MPRTKTTKSRALKFACELCPKAYKDVNGLNRHLHLHDDDYWHCCDWLGCTARFKQASALKIHKNVHLKIRPYVCPLCESCFGDPSSLSRHLKSLKHRDEPPPYGCPACVSRYSRKAQLRRHMDIKHGLILGNSTMNPLPRLSLLEPARQKAKRLKEVALGSKPSRASKKSRKAQGAYDPPLSLEYQSAVKPEPQGVPAQYMGIDYGAPQQPNHYAQGLAPLSVPPSYVMFDGRGTETPWHGNQELPRLTVPPSQYGYTASNLLWDGTRRYVPSPDGSSARPSPLASPNNGAVHSLASSPATNPRHFQAYDPPSYQKPTYAAAGQSMWVQESQYPGTPDGGCLPDIQLDVQGPAHEWDMNAYLNYSYGV